MALNPKLSTASRNLALDAALDVLDGGTMNIYDGTQPAGPGTAIGAQVLLATLTLNATAFGAAAAGAKTANAITNGTGLVASTATWYRLLTAGAVAVADGSVGTATSNLVLTSDAIAIGGTVTCTSLVFSMAA
jgi:hypothetical protein